MVPAYLEGAKEEIIIDSINRIRNGSHKVSVL